jgi:hypothetical protein
MFKEQSYEKLKKFAKKSFVNFNPGTVVELSILIQCMSKLLQWVSGI